VRVLVDTSALLALSLARDQRHAAAVRIARARVASGARYVGTTLILAEFHTRLLYARGADDARDSVSRLVADPLHEWLSVGPDLVQHAVARWLVRFADQPFSLTDAVSFEVMRKERLTHAFAFDEHFVTAGFKLLE
jgi:predicted nucleic acid-binding protein